MNKRWLAVGLLVLALFLLLSMRRGRDLRIRNIVSAIPRHPSRTYDKRDLSDVWEVVLHHTAGPADQSPADIARYHSGPNHICESGCPGISYHFLIDRSGRIYQTQELDTISFHTGGRNTPTVGIALIGNYDQLEPSSAIIEAIRYTVRHIERKVGRQLFLTAHRDHKSTSCPGQNIDLESIMNRQVA